MKNLINLILIVGLLASCTNQSNENHNFTINGKINGDYSGLAFLFKRVSGEWTKLDSTVVKDGSFAFKGNIKSPIFKVFINTYYIWAFPPAWPAPRCPEINEQVFTIKRRKR